MKYQFVDIYDKDGNMVRIEAFKESGEFVMQALWDPSDEQTHDNRVQFRNWFYKHMERTSEGR